VVGGALLLSVLFTGCKDDTIHLAYRPKPGDHHTYEVRVRAVTVRTIGGGEPNRTEIENVFEAHHSVLEAGPAGSRVEVKLIEQGGEARTFVVTLDRAAQLAEVQRIEGLPASALGGLGLSEIFPAAAAAPPDRLLSPGDRWSIDEPVRLVAPEPAQLRGSGRLAKIGVVDGRDVATVESNYELGVARTAEEGQGQLILDGAQDTSSTTTYDLGDGALVSARSYSKATYNITLLPPAGTVVAPIPGTLTLEVRSTTRRRT
jgi:hypothetical protein